MTQNSGGAILITCGKCGHAPLVNIWPGDFGNVWECRNCGKLIPERFEEKAIDIALEPTAIIETIPFVDKTGQHYHKAHMAECKLIRDTPRFVAFDAGQSFDCFAGAACHLSIQQDNTGNQEFVTIFDWVFKVLPTDNTEV